jgi:exodeoxyribonuclease-3
MSRSQHTPPLTIATWNVNSLKARLPHVQQWVADVQPDILMLQELKCETDAFPMLEIQAMGYQAAVVGQKTYNGVALLSKKPVTITQTRLPGEETDAQARYVEAEIGGMIFASIYLPNGNPVGDVPAESEKYNYKLRWMARLEAHVRTLLATEKPVILGGDFNIIPTVADVYDPQGWAQDALFRSESRDAWQRLCNLGLTESFHALHPQEQRAYSFWDYQQGAWQKDWGIRIDHFLLSPEAADLLLCCTIDRTPRGWEKASDHTPVVMQLNAVENS